ncbi:MAG: hypothetical protein SD837_19640 [Candidatus Electrothrix scaldis]|nr:MAG: hypothetical protein SD837_19640 [Candidatus Electrothrix sp. GW3-3]
MQYEILLNKLIELEKTEAELKKIISSFSTAYDQKLGKYIEELLLLRKNWYEAESLIHPEQRRIFEEVCDDYESYRKTYNDSLNETACDLNPKDQIVIKKLWKKACKLCHPDIVSHKQAEETFKRLNNAYKKNDLNQVKEILSDLEGGIFSEGKNDYKNNKEYLTRKIKHIKCTIRRLKREINELKNSSIYQEIFNIKNWDDYFSIKRDQLKEKIKIWKRNHFNEA